MSQRLASICIVLFALAFPLLGAVAPACAAGPGAKIWHELREKEQFYADQQWQDYVTAIGERLLEVSAHKGREYTFTVLDNPTPNASATEDGYIFVNRGLLAYLSSEDELAGVIGHEIGHVIGNHVKEGNRKRFLGEIAGWLGALATGTNSVWDLTNTLTATMQSGYGRAAELEADEFGAKFLALSGYDPHAMLEAIHVLKDHQMFQKQVRNKPTAYHGLFSTHPNNDKRLHELVGQSQHLMPDELSEPVGDFWGLMDGLVFGDEAATGLLKGSTFYHGSLRVVIEFPKDWSVTNTSGEIMSRAPGGSIEANIRVQRQDPPSGNQSPEEYVTETLKRDDVENGKSVEINGLPAYIADIKVAGDKTRARKIAIIYHNRSVYVFNGEAGAGADVEDFAQKFETTVASLRGMTAADLRVANAQRIRVIEAKPGDTYRKLAQTISIKTHGEETLRVINGHHPSGEPRAGDLIKVVR